MPETMLFYPGQFAEARKPNGVWDTVKVETRDATTGELRVRSLNSADPIVWWIAPQNIRPYGAGTGQPQTTAVPLNERPVAIGELEEPASIERSCAVTCCWLIAEGEIPPIEPKEARSIYDSMVQAVSRLRRDYNGRKEDLEQLEVQLAGCLTAAEGSTTDVAAKHSYGWSPAYETVLELRRKYDRLSRDAADLGKIFGRQRSTECRGSGEER